MSSFGGGENTSGGPTGAGGAGNGMGSNYGGNGDDSGWNDRRQLEAKFTSQIDPLMSRAYSSMGNLGGRVMGFGINAALNSMLPGLGLVAGVTGLTHKATDFLRDTVVSREIAGILGVNDNRAINSGVEGVVDAARRSGRSEREIANAYNTTSQRRGGVMGLWDDLTGDTAASAATSAAGTAASYQQQAINFLKQMAANPLAAQHNLAGIYGLPGGTGSQAKTIAAAKASPLYKNIMSGLDVGEDAIMRNAAATGGLRSGNVQYNLADYGTRLSNEALSQAYGQQLSGLQGLAGLGTYSGDIAGLTSGIGSTLAAGQTAAAQAQQSGTGNLIGLGGAIYQGLGGYQGISDIAGGIADTIGSWF